MDRVVYTLHDEDAKAFFEYAGFRARNLREPLKRAASTLLHHINMTFATEGDWIGHPWPELNPSYERWKAQHYPGRPMLVMTGRLRAAAISNRSVSTSDNQLRWSVDVPYAHIHQDGAEWVTIRREGNRFTEHLARVPARPFMEVTPGLLEAIENDFRVWLEELKAVNKSRRSLSLPNPFG